MEAQLQAAKEQQDFQAAVSQLRDLALGQHPNDAESIKIKEQAIQASTRRCCCCMLMMFCCQCLLQRMNLSNSPS